MPPKLGGTKRLREEVDDEANSSISPAASGESDQTNAAAVSDEAVSDEGSSSNDDDGDEEENQAVAAGEDEDEEVTEARRKTQEQHLEEMREIEGEYMRLKNSLFEQRLQRVEDSLRKLDSGKLGRFKLQQEALEKSRARRVAIAAVRKRFREANVIETRASTLQRAQTDLTERCRVAKAQMIDKLNLEMTRARKNKEAMDRPPEVNEKEEEEARQRAEQLAKERAVERARKRRKAATTIRERPYVVYQLDDYEIMADMRQFLGANHPSLVRQRGYYESR